MIIFVINFLPYLVLLSVFLYMKLVSYESTRSIFSRLEKNLREYSNIATRLTFQIVRKLGTSEVQSNRIHDTCNICHANYIASKTIRHQQCIHCLFKTKLYLYSIENLFSF